jgi:hypothetical protein
MLFLRGCILFFFIAIHFLGIELCMQSLLRLRLLQRGVAAFDPSLPKSTGHEGKKQKQESTGNEGNKQKQGSIGYEGNKQLQGSVIMQLRWDIFL